MIYLNNTATSFPKPKQVIEGVSNYISSIPVHSARTGIEMDADDYEFMARQNLANIFNVANPLNIVFTSGSTEALNLAIKGLPLSGKHVVTTAIEHNSVIRPLKTLERDGVIELDFVPCNKYAYVEPATIEKAIKENTSLIVVNHCSNVTGSVLDLKAIAEIAHTHNCKLLVDASQSAGMIPIDASGWDIDFFAFTGHKSLFGLPGTGGLYMKNEFELEPLKTGGTGVKSEVLLQPREMTMYYEAGTPNCPGIVSINYGTRFILDTGMDKIHAYKTKLVKKMISELEKEPEITIYSDPEHSSYSNFCFNIANMVPEEVNYALESTFDIHVRSGLHCAPLLLEALGVHPWGTVRASPSYFTTEEDVDTFIDAIRQILHMFARRKSCSRS